MAKKYSPRDNLVLLEVVRPGEEIVGGGILIPDSAQEISAVGLVLARGPDAYEAIKPGRKVLFQPYLAEEAWDEDGRRLVFVLDDNIYACLAYDGTGPIPDTLPGELLSERA
jgi:co-chaperonin GroES (HSP10)